MDHQDIARIRGATFAEARRGYDKREVELFLGKLADWLESGAIEEAGSYAVKLKLERAGETTARILGTAEEEAQELRREAGEEADRIVTEAEQQARETVEAANRRSERTVSEGEERRRAIEGVIADLVARRDEVLDDIERLSGRLHAALDTYTPPSGADPFAPPAVLDPAERGPDATAELPEGQPTA